MSRHTPWKWCRFYWGVSMASLFLYFVTSSDTASLVIDCLTANGDKNPPYGQRIFWSLTEGAVAITLLHAGGEKGLQALRGVSILASVPFTIVLCLMCKALWETLSEERDIVEGKPKHMYNTWATQIIDVLDSPTFSVPQVHISDQLPITQGV